MQLTFLPALGSTTVVALSPRTDGHLVFRARFVSREQFYQAQQDGARIELWTNLPVKGSKSVAWNSLLFQEADSAIQPGDESSADTVVCLADSAMTSEQHEHDLILQVPICLQSSSSSKFSFTYRLVYPSGAVHWLGEYGQNGDLVLEPRNYGVSLADGWSRWESGSCTFDNCPAMPGPVGALNMEIEWSILGLRRDSWPAYYTAIHPTASFSELLLFPQPLSCSVLSPQALIFTASPGSSIRITSAGGLIYTPSGDSKSLALRSCDLSAIDVSLDDILHSNPSGLHVLLDHHPNSTHAIIASRAPSSTLPICLTMIPLSSQATEKVPPSLRLSNMFTISPESRRFPLAFFSSSARKGFLISSDHSQHVAFRVGRSGAQVVMAPSYSMEVTFREGKRTWDLFLLNPHENGYVQLPSSAEEEVQRLLPTPPPSPPPQRMSTTSITPIQADQFSQDSGPSSLQILASLNDEFATSSSAASLATSRTTQGSPPTSPTSIVGNSTPMGVRATASPLPSYLHVFFTMVTWLTGTFYGGLASFWLMAGGVRLPAPTEAMRDETSDGRIDVSHGGVSEVDDAHADSKSACEEGSAHGAGRPEPTGDTGSDFVGKTRSDDRDQVNLATDFAILDVPAPQPSTPSLISMFPQDVLKLDTPHMSATDSPVFTADIRGVSSVISILVRVPLGACPADLVVTFDGEVLPKPCVTEVGEKMVYLLEFDARGGSRGGHLEAGFMA